MKSQIKLIYTVIIATTIVACNAGNQQPATTTVQPAQDYVKSLQAINIESDQSLNQAKNKLIKYYSQVTIESSLYYNHTIIDCVPFDQQPALINASAATKNHALSLLDQTTTASICSTGDIPIIRIPAQVFAQKIHSVIFKKPIQSDSVTLPYDNSGYMYYKYNAAYQPPVSESQQYGTYLSNLDFNKNGGVVMIDSGEEQANIVNSANNFQHYLLQEWIAAGQKPYIATLETGIITSNYFMQESDGTYSTSFESSANSVPAMTKSIFIFSTPNAYDSSTESGNDANQYNLQGGFIQTSSFVTFGAPLADNEKYLLAYVQKSDGYHLFVSKINQDSSNHYKVDAPHDVGYWPLSRYSGYGSEFPYPPQFTNLSGGFEMDVGESNLTPINVNYSDGAILGLGFSSSLGDIESLFPANNQTFAGINMPSTSSYTPKFNNVTLTDTLGYNYNIGAAYLQGIFTY